MCLVISPILRSYPFPVNQIIIQFRKSWKFLLLYNFLYTKQPPNVSGKFNLHPWQVARIDCPQVLTQCMLSMTCLCFSHHHMEDLTHLSLMCTQRFCFQQLFFHFFLYDLSVTNSILYLHPTITLLFCWVSDKESPHI